MAKNPDGFGTVYREDDPRRKTKWRAEKSVELPNGVIKRVVARGVTQREALDKLRRKVERLQLANPQAERLSFAEYWERWLEFQASQLAPRSIRDYADSMRLYIAPAIGRLPLARVSSMHIQGLLSTILARGHYATADKVRRILKAAFRQAIKWDLLTRDPTAKLDPIRKRPPKRGKLEPEGVEAFLAASEHSRFYPFFYLAVFTGMRIGELQTLKWSDIKGGYIHVQRTYARYSKTKEGPPKTRSGNRRLPITPGVERVLNEQRATVEKLKCKAGAKWQDNDYVLPSDTGRMLSQSNISKEYKKALRRAELPDIRFHDLRRTYATLLAGKAKATPKLIQKRLGHSTPRMALEAYTDVLEAEDREAVLDEDMVFSGGGKGGNEDEES